MVQGSRQTLVYTGDGLQNTAKVCYPTALPTRPYQRDSQTFICQVGIG